MPRALAIAITATDLAFLFYWSLAALSQLGIVEIPPAWMYADYEQPDVIAWNWSFLPMDLAFSYFGLRAVAASRRGDERWRNLAIVSLTLTMAAGGMAISYWLLKNEIDPFWFASNAALVVWPLFFLPKLIAGSGSPPPHPLFDRYLAAHGGNDLEGVLSLFEEDAVLEDPVGQPPLRGIEGIRSFYAETHQKNGPLIFERVGPVLEGGEERTARVRARFATQPISAAMDVVYVVTLSPTGQIASLRAFY